MKWNQGMNKHHKTEAAQAIAKHIYTDEINKLGVKFSMKTCLALADEILSIHTDEWHIAIKANIKEKDDKS